MGEEMCGTCRYWDVYPFNNDGGECRRYPPVLLVSITYDEPGEVFTQQPDQASPSTARDYWCGEYKAMEAKAG